MSSSNRRKLHSVSSPASSPVPSPSSGPRLRPQSPPTKTSSSSSSLSQSPSNILLFLIAFRLINAFTVRTFFQPDEFFQSLEPAWQLVFGENKGAWITWEWKHELRSSIHPLLFAAIYYVADIVAHVVHLSPATRADLLVAAPKIAQAIIAAVGDFYTWKLARYVYGSRSPESWATLALTVVSPWQWFCSTRTFSNCLETTITIVALYLWPWSWSLDISARDEKKKSARGARKGWEDDGVLTRLRLCLSLAALACILRPTNILIWITLASVACLRSSWTERKILTREVFLCGPAVLVLSALVDRLFYGNWTFPPLKFLYFNIAQSLSVFYGRNDWHYYVSQGYPLLLTTALPFTLVGLYRALTQIKPATSGGLQPLVQVQLALVCLIMPFVLSLISHKEVRFIYPLLPSLHVLTAPPLVDCFLPAVIRSSRAYMPRRLTLVFLLLVNVIIALYTSIYHAPGAVNILSYLRDQHQMHVPIDSSTSGSQNGITAGFLMPCHSTPWRSHLVYPTIHAWALSCEPPIGLNNTQKAAYMDEADQFYDNPGQFLREHMVGGLRYTPRKPSYLSPQTRTPNSQLGTSHEWPDYLIFFAQLEPTLQSLLRSTSYAECQRSWNTAWHDDWRRKGDIVVWCLDPSEQQAWRSATRQQHHENREYHFDRIIEGIKREALGKRKSSPFQQWMSSLSASWPWGQRKRTTWLGFQVPHALTTGSSWKLPAWKWSELFGGKKKKTNKAADLWS